MKKFILFLIGIIFLLNNSYGYNAIDEGDAYFLIQDYQKAISSYESIENIDDELLYKISMCYLLQNDINNAKKSLQKIFKNLKSEYYSESKIINDILNIKDDLNQENISINAIDKLIEIENNIKNNTDDLVINLYFNLFYSSLSKIEETDFGRCIEVLNKINSYVKDKELHKVNQFLIGFLNFNDKEKLISNVETFLNEGENINNYKNLLINFIYFLYYQNIVGAQFNSDGVEYIYNSKLFKIRKYAYYYMNINPEDADFKNWFGYFVSLNSYLMTLEDYFLKEFFELSYISGDYAQSIFKFSGKNKSSGLINEEDFELSHHLFNNEVLSVNWSAYKNENKEDIFRLMNYKKNSMSRIVKERIEENKLNIAAISGTKILHSLGYLKHNSKNAFKFLNHQYLSSKLFGGTVKDWKLFHSLIDFKNPAVKKILKKYGMDFADHRMIYGHNLKFILKNIGQLAKIKVNGKPIGKTKALLNWMFHMGQDFTSNKGIPVPVISELYGYMAKVYAKNVLGLTGKALEKYIANKVSKSVITSLNLGKTINIIAIGLIVRETIITINDILNTMKISGMEKEYKEYGSIELYIEKIEKFLNKKEIYESTKDIKDKDFNRYINLKFLLGKLYYQNEKIDLGEKQFKQILDLKKDYYILDEKYKIPISIKGKIFIFKGINSGKTDNFKTAGAYFSEFSKNISDLDIEEFYKTFLGIKYKELKKQILLSQAVNYYYSAQAYFLAKDDDMKNKFFKNCLNKLDDLKAETGKLLKIQIDKIKLQIASEFSSEKFNDLAVNSNEFKMKFYNEDNLKKRIEITDIKLAKSQLGESYIGDFTEYLKRDIKMDDLYKRELILELYNKNKKVIEKNINVLLDQKVNLKNINYEYLSSEDKIWNMLIWKKNTIIKNSLINKFHNTKVNDNGLKNIIEESNKIGPELWINTNYLYPCELKIKNMDNLKHRKEYRILVFVDDKFVTMSDVFTYFEHNLNINKSMFIYLNNSEDISVKIVESDEINNYIINETISVIKQNKISKLFNIDGLKFNLKNNNYIKNGKLKKDYQVYDNLNGIFNFNLNVIY